MTDDKVTPITTKAELGEFKDAIDEFYLVTDDMGGPEWRRIADEHWNDNEVAHLMRAGYNVTVLCLHGDNSDYVRLNGMGYDGWCYGVPFGYDWKSKRPEHHNKAKAARYNMFLSSLAQHRPDAIAFQWIDQDGKQQLTVFNKSSTSHRLPDMYEIMGL